MTKKYKEIFSRHAEICRFIVRRNLKDAFEALDLWMKENKAWALGETREELCSPSFPNEGGFCFAFFNAMKHYKCLTIAPSR